MSPLLTTSPVAPRFSPWCRRVKCLHTSENSKSEVQKTIGWHVRCLRSDGGKEYFVDAFTPYLWQKGIQWEFTRRHTPQQNGVAQCKNRRILEVARVVSKDKHMPKSYWAESANTTVYLMNWCTTSEVHDATPHKKYYEKKLDLSHVRIFGSIAYVHIPDEKR